MAREACFAGRSGEPYAGKTDWGSEPVKKGIVWVGH